MKTMITKLTGRTLAAEALGMPCFDATAVDARGSKALGLAGLGLSSVGAGVDATRVRLAAAALVGNGSGAWNARRDERPTEAPVALLTAFPGGYGDVAGAGAGSIKHQHSFASQKHTQHLQQQIAAQAITMRAFRGPRPWIERT
ncbi:hypothetical protein [Streptacidiphilus fuscans]|uniref:Uncharacterized protein n=1 Tax=Streptacidiphilus fuscans TaxID=2789292 RepID=A0A931AY67_9ACTN|nr:hypothetical protein [Streptacidiphilus fuscans]MBF9067604.1 hypothetical protein [Streptacidiphilus fuscans]